jgi:hypothetical protein
MGRGWTKINPYQWCFIMGLILMFNLSTPVGRCKTASGSHFRVGLAAHMALRITYFEVPY